MKLRLVAIATLLALLTGLVVAPIAMAKPAPIGVPVSGTFTDAVGGIGTYAGSFNITKFTVQNGQLAAVGTFTGTLTNSLGNAVGNVSQSATVPVAIAQATCDILELTLGPLDLNLLGLVVHLDQVHLEITAEQGPGNLLGNLLCAVAGILDGGLSLNILADLLNTILNILRELGLGFA
jgi:hypothetical protein